MQYDSNHSNSLCDMCLVLSLLLEVLKVMFSNSHIVLKQKPKEQLGEDNDFSRMAVARAKPEFFVPRMKDDVKENESLLLNEVKRWDKDSVVWGHKMKRKAAVSWESLRERAILGLIGVGEVNESKSKVKELEKIWEIWSGLCTCELYIGDTSNGSRKDGDEL
ncbi:hypothetical protein L1887_01110 [Cichorium endivia]|nr:hypothetical protein L1887_01110 [Cichorium endivia]